MMANNTKTKKNNFNKLSKKFESSVIKKALTTSALLVQGDATRLCPVDTGKLRSSINYVVDDNSATIGTNVEYAKRIEYGGSRQAPNGYLRPAFYKNEDKIKSIFEKTLKGLEKI